MRATDGGGLDEVASDGVSPGTPGQRERSVFHLRDTHTTRRTYSCMEVGAERMVIKQGNSRA